MSWRETLAQVAAAGALAGGAGVMALHLHGDMSIQDDRTMLKHGLLWMSKTRFGALFLGDLTSTDSIHPTQALEEKMYQLFETYDLNPQAQMDFLIKRQNLPPIRVISEAVTAEIAKELPPTMLTIIHKTLHEKFGKPFDAVAEVFLHVFDTIHPNNKFVTTILLAFIGVVVLFVVLSLIIRAYNARLATQAEIVIDEATNRADLAQKQADLLRQRDATIQILEKKVADSAEESAKAACRHAESLRNKDAKIQDLEQTIGNAAEDFTQVATKNAETIQYMDTKFQELERLVANAAQDHAEKASTHAFALQFRNAKIRELKQTVADSAERRTQMETTYADALEERYEKINALKDDVITRAGAEDRAYGTIRKFRTELQTQSKTIADKDDRISVLEARVATLKKTVVARTQAALPYLKSDVVKLLAPIEKAVSTNSEASAKSSVNNDEQAESEGSLTANESIENIRSSSDIEVENLAAVTAISQHVDLSGPQVSSISANNSEASAKKSSNIDEQTDREGALTANELIENTRSSSDSGVETVAPVTAISQPIDLSAPETSSSPAHISVPIAKTAANDGEACAQDGTHSDEQINREGTLISDESIENTRSSSASEVESLIPVTAVSQQIDLSAPKLSSTSAKIPTISILDGELPPSSQLLMKPMAAFTFTPAPLPTPEISSPTAEIPTAHVFNSQPPSSSKPPTKPIEAPTITPILTIKKDVQQTPIISPESKPKSLPSKKDMMKNLPMGPHHGTQSPSPSAQRVMRAGAPAFVPTPPTNPTQTHTPRPCPTPPTGPRPAPAFVPTPPINPAQTNPTQTHTPRQFPTPPTGPRHDPRLKPSRPPRQHPNMRNAGPRSMGYGATPTNPINRTRRSSAQAPGDDRPPSTIAESMQRMFG